MTGLDGAVGASSAVDGQRAGTSHTGNGRVRLLHNALVSTLVARMSLSWHFSEEPISIGEVRFIGAEGKCLSHVLDVTRLTRLGHLLPLANG